MLREIYEETGMDLVHVAFQGLITWSTAEGAGFGGLYLYHAIVPADMTYETPRKTPEGILDWKEIEWVLHPNNQGVARNIPQCLENIQDGQSCFHLHSFFTGNEISHQISNEIEPRIENDEAFREAYLSSYLRPYLDKQIHALVSKSD